MLTMLHMNGLDLKLKRVAADVRAIELAEEAGWSSSRVSYIEGQRRVHTPATVARYLDALDKCVTKSTRTEGAA